MAVTWLLRSLTHQTWVLIGGICSGGSFTDSWWFFDTPTGLLLGFGRGGVWAVFSWISRFGAGKGMDKTEHPPVLKGSRREATSTPDTSWTAPRSSWYQEVWSYPPGVSVEVAKYGCGCQNRVGIPFWLVGEFTTHSSTYFSGDLDVHWAYGILTHGHLSVGVAYLSGSDSSKGCKVHFCWWSMVDKGIKHVRMNLL